VTLYVDTSSLIKLYVAEDGSDAVRQLVSNAHVVSTSVVASFAEVAGRAGTDDTRFSSFDDRLNEAARKLTRTLEPGGQK
jgi:predicted nucleic acid-binding protein